MKNNNTQLTRFKLKDNETGILVQSHGTNRAERRNFIRSRVRNRSELTQHSI